MLKQADIYPSHEKGYNFECELRDLATNSKFTDFECNNLESIQTWYRSIGKGADFKFHINGKRVEVENKYLDKRGYKSWVLRDYVTRFTYALNTIMILVCNNIFRISQDGREELKLRHIKVMNQYQLIWYLFKLSRKRGNKYVCYRNSFYSNSSCDQSSSPEICTDITNNTIKIKPETVTSSKIKNGSLENKSNRMHGATSQVDRSNKDNTLLIRIMLMALLMPLLNCFDRSNANLRSRFFSILTKINTEILALPSPLFHVKHTQRILLNRSRNTPLSAVCNVTPQLFISESSFEFLASPSGVHPGTN